jgi:hypothetical protein
MKRVLFARTWAAVFALLAVGVTLPARARLAVNDGFTLPPRTASEIPLPAGFAATVDRATRDQFVGVVAGDVDHDGDLDVVASLGSLDLAVWRNDGAGHFTRLPSGGHSTVQAQPPVPSVDGDPIGPQQWIQNGDPRGADLVSRRARASDDPESPLTPAAIVGVRRFGPRAVASRAPPLA